MQTPAVSKEQSFKLRLDETDRQRLDLLAEHYSLSVAGIVRMLVKRDVDALGLTAGKPKAKVKR